MKIAIPALLLATALTAFAQSEERIDRRFSIPAGGQLVVDVGVGSIEVNTHNGDEVIVSVERKIKRRNTEAEEAYLRDHPVNIAQDGSVITISSRHTRADDSWSWWRWMSRGNQTEVKYRVVVPEAFSARLKTSGGGIAVSDLTGDLRANTSGGSLRFQRLHGAVVGQTSGGSIRADECEGIVKIRTSGGRIEVTGGAGSLDGRTSGGSIRVERFRGPVVVHTSGGGVTIQDPAGKIDGSTSGGSINARLSSRLNDGVSLKTSGGSVTLQVAADSAFNLDAATSGGSVSSDLPVTMVGDLKRGRLNGTVNGGGHPVVLRSSGGSIQVKTL